MSIKYTIKARQTTYKGVIFRSCLEAMYAQSFDKNDLKWKYEPVCVMFESGERYTPDFVIENYQGRKVFVEVKPNRSFLDPKIKTRIWSFIKDTQLVGGASLNVEKADFFCFMGDPNSFAQALELFRHGHPESMGQVWNYVDVLEDLNN